MRWSKPLRLHLSILIVSLLLSTSAPLIWLTFSQGREAAIAAGEKQMRLMSLRLVEGYKNALEGGYGAVAVASTLPQLVSRPPQDLEAKQRFFLEVLRTVPNATSIYAGYPDGSYVQVINAQTGHVRATLSPPDGAAFAIRTIAQRQREDVISTLRFTDSETRMLQERKVEPVTYDPRQRPWYRSVLFHGVPVSVGPYVTGMLRIPTLTMAVPMKDNGQIVVGIDVHLDTVSRLLNAQEISPRARSYIVDDRDRLVAHSDPAMMSRILGMWSQSQWADETAAKSLDTTVKAVIRLRQNPMSAKGATTQFDLDGVTYLAQIAPVTFSGLFKGNSIAVVVPLEDLVAQANRQLTRNLAIAAAFVIAGVAASVVLSRIISRSLYQLSDEARRIGDLNFASGGESHSWISEINTLAGALRAAQRGISQFALYVPREVVRRIVDPERRAVAKAHRQDVTVLFTDIRDFTTISERYSPEEVVDILSTYFELLNAVVERHGGTLVQYLGDSLFAMWNAPVPDAQHVENGCRCALEMRAAIDTLNGENRRSGRPELFTRFGLHTGPAVVGSFGAISRQQYTAMGDTINVASRLEGLNKELGTSILCSSAIIRAVEGIFEFQRIGLVKVKGRAREVDVWELTGDTAARLATPNRV
ncbi:adenylate cyclase [Ensifer sp. WSM1721]|uniref:adenylate/guanylate cyclase domain-containing protein n=1 Tax=Ensifer sp. WSM1721 TaxID=1041159 RepID=UPI000479BA99|nr:adenylate/guanylate cyclase domain-containing protein [Ensifer sp. WSM1721]